MPEEPESYWTAVANIVRERPYGPGGVEIRLGTKHFAPGAKVYIIDWFPGTCERIVVVGMHRKSKKFIAIVLSVKLVENLRYKVCYQPAVLAKIKEYCARQYTTSLHHLTQEFAETICRVVPIWQTQSWRILLPEPAEKPSPTLQLLREADRRLSSDASVMPPAVAPVPQAVPLITKLWRSILFLLKD